MTSRLLSTLESLTQGLHLGVIDDAAFSDTPPPHEGWWPVLTSGAGTGPAGRISLDGAGVCLRFWSPRLPANGWSFGIVANAALAGLATRSTAEDLSRKPCPYETVRWAARGPAWDGPNLAVLRAMDKPPVRRVLSSR